MARKPSKAQLDSSIRKLRSASNDLTRYGRRLRAAGRELERETDRARSRLRQLPRTQPPLSAFEETLLSSVSEHVAADPVDRPHDIFLSHATADLDLARALHNALEELGAEVWMDDFNIKLGQNIVRAIDRGISLSRVGVVLVTPAVIAGRFWVEKEFSALLNSKETVIPVLHEVSWTELEAYSPLLQLNRGLTTQERTIEEIAVLIAQTLVREAA